MRLTVFSFAVLLASGCNDEPLRFIEDGHPLPTGDETEDEGEGPVHEPPENEPPENEPPENEPPENEPPENEPPGVDEWMWTNPLPNSNDFHAASFADAQLGLIAGFATLKRTVDGGAVWSEVDPHLIDIIEAIEFTSATHAVAVGFNVLAASLPGARAMTTDDGGLTWQLRELPDPLSYFSNGGDLDFDHDVGAAVGNDRVMVSVDAGVTWTDRSPPDAAGLSAVHVRGQRLWTSGAQVHLSIDLGVTWTTPLAAPVGFVVGLAFTSDDVGVATTDDESVWRTTDGGAAWTLVFASPRGRLLRRVRFFDDGTTAMAVGWDGACLVSTAASAADAGLDWRTCASPHPYAYFFATPGVGSTIWTVGTRGLVYRSEDFGTSWTLQTAGARADLRRAFFLDGERGWAVGELGGIMKTVDAGRTWRVVLGQYEPYALPGFTGRWVINALLGVHFVDENVGWAVGTPVRTDATSVITSAVILHSTDGGDTWSAQESGTTLSLHAIDCADASHCWAVGTSVIVHTVDGGASWVTQTPANMHKPLRGIDVVAADNLWVAGEGGVLAHSIDGGVTFTNVEKPLGMYEDVKFVDELHGIAGGANADGTFGGEVTHDGGATWLTFRVGDNGLPFGAALAAGGLNGIAPTNGGDIWRTRDGGVTWDLELHPTFNELLDVWPTAAGFAVVGAAGSTLLGPLEQ